MDSKLTSVLVVMSAVIIGVGLFAVKKNSDYVLELVKDQNRIMSTQTEIMTALSQSASSNSKQQVVELSKVVAGVEQRLGSLEKKVQSGNVAQPPPIQRPPQQDTTVYEIPVGDSYVRGPADAAVTITEFVDLECPFCARFHKPIVDVLAKYPGQVRYMMKNFPLAFHPNARPAAKAAMAAGEQGKFYEMADLLLENGRNLNSELYVNLAADLGLDVEQFKSDLQANDALYEKRIQADIQLANKIGVRGTPTFLINGKKTQARTLEQYQVEIDKLINK